MDIRVLLSVQDWRNWRHTGEGDISDIWSDLQIRDSAVGCAVPGLYLYTYIDTYLICKCATTFIPVSFNLTQKYPHHHPIARAL